jgi:murein L,D-transpeptidase YafK
MLNIHRTLILCGALGLPLTAHAFSLPWLSDSPRPPTGTSSTHATSPAETGRHGDTRFADRIVVKKAERRLYLMTGDKPVRIYKVALGYQPKGPKRYQGDGRTPEGRYFIEQRRDRSKYRKALQISYPNPSDRLRARAQGNDPGGLIMIHGQPTDRREKRTGDWTFGCIAVSDMEIDEIWSLTAQGTPVEILP